MAPSIQAASVVNCHEIVTKADGSSTVQVAAGGVDTSEKFAPSVWGDFFVTYVPPISQRSEDWMRERAEQLKGQVRQAFKGSKDAMTGADALTYVDTLERLGIDNHFREEIEEALSLVHVEQVETDGSNSLHITALKFRLLRQHGLWASEDVFDKFREDQGSFSESVGGDPRGLLSLYNAAHMATPGEVALDDAISFARGHLEAIKGNVGSPIAEQISRALDIPLPRFTRRIETMHYIDEYEQEGVYDGMLLELSRLNFNLIRILHLKELKDLSLWWRDLYETVKLPYARDRMVEIYFWTCGMLHEEEYSRARILFAKVFGMVSLLDDTFDVHATLEECHKLNEAMQRWDENEVSILPEYLHMLYIKTLGNFKEFEDALEPNHKYRMAYIKKAYKLSSEYYLREAVLSSKKYRPSFKEHEEISIMTSGLPMLTLVTLMGYGDVASQEVFEWVDRVPGMVRAGSQVTRFLNDMSSYKLGKHKKDMPSAVECYMIENDSTGDEAMAAVAALLENRWRILNQVTMEIDRALLPAAQVVVNMARTNEIIYLKGRDAYTFGSDLKDLVTALFLNPVPL
ncbi:eudesmanediol synthase-like [Triticum dicoccoides]|uniref:eudesmanediol synthase-like n=1 Tax=Triticum dicoccoides TaxID=85692 RepID=UPI00188EDF1C|nr:eudesmanediol synthase-like [Triticum dicoccoides]